MKDDGSLDLGINSREEKHQCTEIYFVSRTLKSATELKIVLRRRPAEENEHILMSSTIYLRNARFLASFVLLFIVLLPFGLQLKKNTVDCY